MVHYVESLPVTPHPITWRPLSVSKKSGRVEIHVSNYGTPEGQLELRFKSAGAVNRYWPGAVIRLDLVDVSTIEVRGHANYRVEAVFESA